MQPNPSKELIDALKATAEIYGRDMTPAGAVMMPQDLACYDVPTVLKALARCRQEMRTFPAIADIVLKMQAEDGRPGVEEAWAMCPLREDQSVVWNDEISEAFGVARHLLYSSHSDQVGARMAFKEAYSRIVIANRAANKPLKWWPSLGNDKNQRATALLAAVEKKRISLKDAKDIMPEIEDKSSGQRQLRGPSGLTRIGC